jgi:hypothetical protein
VRSAYIEIALRPADVIYRPDVGPGLRAALSQAAADAVRDSDNLNADDGRLCWSMFKDGIHGDSCPVMDVPKEPLQASASSRSGVAMMSILRE